MAPRHVCQESVTFGFVKEPTAPRIPACDDAPEFIERWTRAGPALEARKSLQLQLLDDETARQMTLDLFALWRPSEIEEMGEGLVEAQKVFIELARSEQERKPER